MNAQLIFLSNSQTEVDTSDRAGSLFFQSFEEFLLLDYEKSIFFVVESNSLKYIEETVWKIRTHPEFFHFLCFVNDAINGKVEYLVDGIGLSKQEQSEQIALFEELIDSFKTREEPLYRDDRLLKYLWVRPDYAIQPYHEWNYRRFYIYPLLEALSFNEVNAFDWLKSLMLHKLLVKQKLVDRQRECPQCLSAHLSFVDICPNCGSMDITQQIALHCFTCGQVGPQNEFLRKGALICPKCETQLKHIGSDYDRPIENYSCNDCHHFFSEGKILARCAECNKSCETEELTVHDISNFQLSEQGRITAIRGEIADVLAIFSGKNFVVNEVFLHDLDWLLLQSDRYKEVKFSVLGLYFENLYELMKETSQSIILRQMEGIAERIRELLRDPDLCTRSNENVIWMLLPQTEDNGLTGLKNRLDKIVDSIQQDEKNQFKLICKFTEYLSTQRIKNEPAELLLARLKGNML